MGATQSSSVLCALDKFRGTASARELGEAVARVVRERGLIADVQPMSDGGEGFSDAFAGTSTTFNVPGPLSTMVEARFTLHPSGSSLVGVVEVADVIGRRHLTHPTNAEALNATSVGVGHLIVAGLQLGVDSLLIGCGDSATSDGGYGCYRVLLDAGGLGVPVTVATDVTARFSGALRYAEQKGVSPHDLTPLDQRLSQLRARYLHEQGVDVELRERSGAAGGIAGALAALGAQLVSGLEAVATSVDLASRSARASLVVTGEGRFDAGSLEGKVVVGLAALVGGIDVLVICGSVEPTAGAQFLRRFPRATLVSLEKCFGDAVARSQVLACVQLVVAAYLDRTGNDTFSSY